MVTEPNANVDVEEEGAFSICFSSCTLHLLLYVFQIDRIDITTFKWVTKSDKVVCCAVAIGCKRILPVVLFWVNDVNGFFYIHCDGAWESSLLISVVETDYNFIEY